MTRLVVLTIAFLATIKSVCLGLVNEVCPFDEQAVDATGRRCTREAACTGESDKADCKGRRRCRCDDICGFICIKVFLDNYCNEDDLPSSTIGLTYELSRDPIRFGTTATYSCGIGYEMSNSSLNVRKCRGDGRWSGQTPTCLTSVSCTAPPKVQRAMHNGRDENGNDRQLYAVGEKLKYSCNAGYYPFGSGSIQCKQTDSNNAVWSVLDPTFECRPKSCGSPGTISNGYRVGNVFSFSEEVTFHCNEGYRIQGRSYRVCQADGEWSGFTPVCIPVSCPSLTDPENGEVFGMDFTFGERVKLDCNVGFVVPATDGLRSVYTYCQANGQWDKSVQCEAVNCGDPGEPQNGVRNGDNFGYNGYILFSCDADHQLVGEKSIFCQENNKWSAERPSCLAECVLPDIPRLLQVPFDYNPGESVIVGTTYYISCPKGYTLNSDNGVWECIGGRMSFDPTCTENSCPPPANINDGHITYSSNPVSGLYSPYTTATYNCNDGFKLSKSGTISRRCREGKFKGTAPTCTETICTIPTVQHSENDASNSRPFLKHGQSVTYTCNDGYTSEDVLQLTCWNERLTHNPPVCRESPCTGISSDRLEVAYNRAGTAENGVIVYEAGTIATFLCNPGNLYYASEPLATCRLGQFQPQVTCEKYATCPSEEVTNGVVSYKDETANNYIPENGYVRQEVTRTVRCTNPYKIEGQFKSVCTKSGKWSNEKPSCTEPNCVIPPPPNYGEYIFDGTTAVGVGYKVSYPNEVKLRCQAPNSKIVGTGACRCDDVVVQIPQCMEPNEFYSKNLCKLYLNPDSGWFSYSNSLEPGSKIRLGCFGVAYMQTIAGFERTCVRDTNPGNYNYKWSPDISEVPECILDIDSECRFEVVRRGSQPFQASSSRSDISPANGRLYAKEGAWIPGKQEVGQWLEVDLGSAMDVYGVMTQGNYREYSWVTLYKVAYREKYESRLLIVNNENGEVATFVGNVDRRTTSQQVFPKAVRARYVRIYPQEWYIRISLRFGVVACEVPAEESACQVPQVENSIVYINSKRNKTSLIENLDAIVISCARGHTFANGESYLSGVCRNAEIVYTSSVASFDCVKQADTSPSTSIPVEEDCGMPVINKDTVVNVNYRYDLGKSTPSDTKFPSGTILITRCYDIGKYQLNNGGERVCLGGSWTGSPATCEKSSNKLRFVKYLNYNQLPRQVAPNSSYIMNVAEVAKLTVECTVKNHAELRFEPFTDNTELHFYGDYGSPKLYYVIDSPEHSGIYTCWDKDDQDAPPMELEILVVDPIYCPAPPKTNEQISYSEVVDINKFPLDAELTYSCPPQYRLIGETQLKCLYDGKWDFEFPRCFSLSCDSPPSDIDHGTVIGSGTAVNTEIGIYCYAGFHIPGTEEGLLKSVCTDGEWVPALPSACKKTTKCEDVPEKIANGFVINDDTNGRSATIICNNDAFVAGTNDTKTTIRCVDGEWDHPFPSCLISTEPTCPPPPLTLWNGIVRRQNNTVSLICDDGYYIPGTSDVELVVTCENEEWDKEFPVGCADTEEGSLTSQSFSFSDDDETKPDETELETQFCNATVCGQQKVKVFCNNKIRPVLGRITKAEPVYNSTDLEMTISISEWLRPAAEEPSSVELTVNDALVGDCYCPSGSLNTELLIFLRYNQESYSLLKKSYIGEHTTSLQECQ